MLSLYKKKVEFIAYTFIFELWKIWFLELLRPSKTFVQGQKCSNFGFLNFKYALKTRHWADNLKNIVLYLACYFWFLLIKMSVMFLLASIWLPLLCSWRTHILWIRLQSFKLRDHPCTVSIFSLKNIRYRKREKQD